ncbi:MAG: photosynthetic complex assembly protein PuhC [Pseudomonadota bacterium]
MQTNAPNARPMRVSDSEQLIPKVLLRAMLGLVLIALALTTFAVVTDRPHEAQVHTAPVLKSMLIEIKDREDGGTQITDMNGVVLSDTTREASGFLSVVQNALKFQRKQHGVTGNPPVHLIRFADGRIGLRDDATDWKINLIGFGQDNARVWREIIDG